ncbi:MAG TPA: hypothetical protein VK563_01530 [Puia sp.]|nr:hypothetical protein [Puia sp.]
MKRSTFSAIGGWQPLLFCIGMYVVALFFSIFVCSSIFYALNTRSTGKETAKTVIAAPSGNPQLASVTH